MISVYISSIKIKNFRIFDEAGITIEFNRGLNVLVGENDSGKSAILDALRIVLGTTDQAWYRLNTRDFHMEDNSKEISVICEFSELNTVEQACFLECLTYKDTPTGKIASLVLNWSARCLRDLIPIRFTSTLSTGVEGIGPTPSPEAKERLRATYLKALRDASSDMQSGRNSRLSHIIQSVPEVNRGTSEYSEGMDLKELSLSGIIELSNHLLKTHKAVNEVNGEITDILQQKMMLKGDGACTTIEVSGADISERRKVAALLEKLDLSVDNTDLRNYGWPGLGTSNIVSMSCELVLNKYNQKSGCSSFLLIEEPEAHIHAQRQLRLIQSLQEEAGKSTCQTIITTHSPLLASVVKLENITIIKDGAAYPLKYESTQLVQDDYKYLERYLDATKANLFFAKGVVVVEGPAEELLLPTIAKLLGYDFTEYGISIINVRGTGLSRFSKIFQRKEGSQHLNIKVACLMDRDVLPDCAPAICIDENYVDVSSFPAKERRKWTVESEIGDKEKYLEKKCKQINGQLVKAFVSNHWTLEYDLAYSGLIDHMLQVIIDLAYQPQNRENKLEEAQTRISKLDTEEEKASFIYGNL